MKNYNKLIIYTDGGARGNPGPAGIGAVIKNKDGKLIDTVSEYIGKTTNNQAEYRAVIAALDKIKDCEAEELNFFLDNGSFFPFFIIKILGVGHAFFEVLLNMFYNFFVGTE